MSQTATTPSSTAPEIIEPHSLAVAVKERLPITIELPTIEQLRAALVGKATPEQLEQIEWLLTTARALRMSTFAAIGQFMHCEGSTISQIMRGKYPSPLGNFCQRVAMKRESFSDRQKIGEKPFVAGLSVVKNLNAFFELTRQTRQMAFVWGENQTGKTAAIEAYAAREDRDVVHWTIAAGAGVTLSMRNLCQACGVPPDKNTVDAWVRVQKRITEDTLVIVDEFHQAFLAKALKITLIEKVRELFTLRKCGMVLVGTKVFTDAMEDKKYAGFLGQTSNRGVLRMQIPTAPKPSDLPLLYAAYGLPEPEGKAKLKAEAIANGNGIGKLTAYFQVARGLCANKGTPLGWDDFLTTLDTMAAWAGGTVGGKPKA